MQDNPSAFRLAERKYRFYKKPKTKYDFTDVIDFSNISGNSIENQEKIIFISQSNGMNIYSIKGVDGFYFITNALNIEEQVFWMKKSIKEYADYPNFSNFGGQLQENVWDFHTKSGESIEDPKSKINKLRWITLGYHYNWTTNIYENSPERISKFPDELVNLCKNHANLCSFNSFEPQAGIINYYHANISMMKAHQDESEFTFNQPILSYSIGCSCIFLLGNTSTDIPPIPIWMRSGDLMIMGGHSRVFYHGRFFIF